MRDDSQFDALLQLAGLLSLEARSLLGMAVAHGFDGWPEHVEIGQRLMSEAGVTGDQIKAAGERARMAATEARREE